MRSSALLTRLFVGLALSGALLFSSEASRVEAIDQSAPFEKRLADFGPELGDFLGKVWNDRAKIDLKDFKTGTYTVYGYYSGTDKPDLPFDETVLNKFLDDLQKLAGKNSIFAQVLRMAVNKLNASQKAVQGNTLWHDFFHVLSSKDPSKKICNRIYVHTADPEATIEVMKIIVGQFGKNKGLWEVKTAGPGAVRKDTIVAYLYDDASAKSLADLLNKTATKKPKLFIDELPPLVRRDGPGIGSAGEPPAIELFKKEGNRHSFGSFYSALIWIALRTTPNVSNSKADGRHFLDNMLYSLRLLGIDPVNPQEFPNAESLEKWYKSVKRW
ncbi:MAG: hypothetical protein HQM08_19085 [Candidatus Riflebacteria bacterium]|nr:hypothetical protein [Candidatus Riflebacteria bacterium]